MDSIHSNTGSFKKSKKLLLLLIALPFVTCVVWYVTSFLLTNQSNTIGIHDGCSKTPLPSISTGETASVVNMTTEKAEQIIDLVTGAHKKWGNQTFTENEVKDSMFLTQEILDDMRSNDWSVARAMYWIDKGLDVNATDDRKKTLLDYSAMEGKQDTLEYLVSNKANSNTLTNAIIEALLKIIMMKDREKHYDIGKYHNIVNLLIDAGADTCAKIKIDDIKVNGVWTLTRHIQDHEIKSAIIAKLHRAETKKPCPGGRGV